jgi:hypothetical protein
LIPYLYKNGLQHVGINAQKIVTNAKLNKKGGNISYKYLKNDLHRINASGNVVITTLLDFFRLPIDFPGHSTNDCDQIEQKMRADQPQIQNYIPYIQKHEFEALLFSSIKGFAFIIDEPNTLNQIRGIIEKFANPEQINGGANTSPSKRLLNIFPYKKVHDSELIMTEITIDEIREKCPRFNTWIDKILSQNYISN